MATLATPQPAPAPSAELEIGSVLAERYRIDSLIGEGGAGKVYAAEHVLLRKKVAIKVLRSDRANVPEVVQRFEREAMAAANIEHPNIASAIDFGRLADGSVFLALEYVAGKSLRRELMRGPLSLRRSLHIARQIASALAAAQALGIVHRDLKPENVMLLERPEDPDFVKVLDFGIARVPMAEAGQPLTKLGAVFGTPAYMAPEQALGQRVDGKADLYALGVVLFEMLVGRRPYDEQGGLLAQQLAEPAPDFRARSRGVEVPEEVALVVETLLARDVSARFQNAEAVVRALESLIADFASAPAAAIAVAAQSGINARPLDPKAEPRAPGAATFLPGDPLPAYELTTHFPDKNAPRPSVPLAPGKPTAELPPMSVPPAPLAVSASSLPPAPLAVSASSLPPVGGSGPPAAEVERLASEAPTSGFVAPLSAPPSAVRVADVVSVGAAAPSSNAGHTAGKSDEELANAATRVRLSAPPVGAGGSQAPSAPTPARPWQQEVALFIKRTLAGLAAAFTATCRFLDGERTKLPPSIQARTKGLRSSTLLVGFLTVAGVVVLLGSAAVLRRSKSNPHSRVSEPAINAASASASASPGASARSAAVTATAPTPAQSGAPTDEASLLLELANNYTGERKDAEAVTLIQRVLLRQPELARDARVAKVLAHTVRSEDRAASDQSFALLETTMGETGAEVVYELSLDRSARERPRRYAEAWLLSKDFDRVSSTSLYSAVKLRYAKTCEQKRSLLKLAGDVGGRHTLAYLRELSEKTTCADKSRVDCYPCLGGDSLLADTIARVSARAAN